MQPFTILKTKDDIKVSMKLICQISSRLDISPTVQAEINSIPIAQYILLLAVDDKTCRLMPLSSKYGFIVGTVQTEDEIFTYCQALHPMEIPFAITFIDTLVDKAEKATKVSAETTLQERIDNFKKLPEKEDKVHSYEARFNSYEGALLTLQGKVTALEKQIYKKKKPSTKNKGKA